jgi:hypothetical protein
MPALVLDMSCFKVHTYLVFKILPHSQGLQLIVIDQFRLRIQSVRQWFEVHLMNECLLTKVCGEYIPMYICTRRSIYAHTCVYMYISTYICIYVHTYVHMHICIYVHMYICTYVHMYICIYVHMYICRTFEKKYQRMYYVCPYDALPWHNISAVAVPT